MEEHKQGPPAKVDLSQIRFYRAKVEDAEAMYKIVLDAYIIEVGNTGVAFKTRNRYLSLDEVIGDIRKGLEPAEGSDQPSQQYLVARIGGEDGKILGCIRGVFFIDTDGVEVCECGPIAVSPDAQGSGLGSQIIKEMENLALNERNVSHMQLTAVNWRTDVIPFYAKRGFVEIGTKPFAQPGMTLEESFLSKPSHFIIMRKKLEKPISPSQ